MTKQEILKNFAENLEKERLSLGYTQEKMAKQLDLSLTAYKALIKCERNKIDVFTLVKLYELTGKFAFEFLECADDTKTKIIQKLNYLSEQQLFLIHSVVEIERLFKAEHTDYEDYVTLFIPTGDMKDGMIYDSNHVDKVNVASYRKKFGNKIHYAIEITSSHLAPVYTKGDKLLITKQPIRDGDTGLFLNKEDGRLYIRKMVMGTPCRLIPLNEYGMEFELDAMNKEELNKWIKFGRVLTKIR